jgi:hypothetical protein
MKLPLFIFVVCLLVGCSTAQRLNPEIPEERGQMVDRYMAEFSSGTFNNSKIGLAIREVMMRMPGKDLITVMNRRRPVVFVEVFDVGTAKFVSSSEMILTDQDEPAFQEGMTIVKISTALENGSQEAIMGIVAHELAHRVFDHVRRGKVSCQSEREANQLVKSWGFVKEYEAASQEFGHKKEGSGVASCQEK